MRFGIIGTNVISDTVIAGGKEDPRFEVTAVYSRSQATADAFADKHHIPHRFTSLAAMAESPEVDAVYVASPNAFHAEQSILCMEHGKHVLCEKALASNARQVREMIATARRHNLCLMEAMKPTLTPNFLRARDALPQIGVIRRYFSCYCQYSSRYDRFKEGTVLNAFRPDMSNGSLPDIGVYTIYPMVVLFGRPVGIKANGLLLSSGTDGQGSVTFEYPSMDAVTLYSKIANSSLPTEIQGENGNIVLDRINIISRVCLTPRGGTEQDLTVAHTHHDYYYEVKEFIDLVESGRRQSSINSWDNSLAVMEIMDEIRRQIGVVYPADEG